MTIVSTTSTTTSPILAGVLEIHITDAPPTQDVTDINVSLSNVRISQADSDTGWIDLGIAPKSFDLLQLTVIPGLLGEVNNLSNGTYAQIRMDVQFDSAVISGQTVTTGVKIPINVLKLVGTFYIKSGQKTDITLYFDAAKSLVFIGSDTITFKPTVTMTVQYTKN